MTVMKHAKSKHCCDTSHTAVSAKAGDALVKSEKDSTESKHNLPVFRIPRIPHREDARSSSASVERKAVNCSPVTSLKMDGQKHYGSKANVRAAHATDIDSHNSSVCKHARSGGNDATAKPNTLDDSREMRNKLTGAVRSQSAKPHTSTNAHAGKHQLHSSAVSHDKVTVAQSYPQESAAKLPEELVRAGWKLCWSKQRLRWYVFNVRTGTSSWDVPK